ncbi:MAG: polysaccharide deacetylase family protein [Candidatus Bathyarchaeota archaeon]|nr:polysaccharide deacetylase family protein [Candidatus Bathyarchaeota archaeon]
MNERGCPYVYPDNIVSVETFERQIDYLSREKNVISLLDLVELVRNRVALPPNTVAITFDDGYYDFYSTAYPILKRHMLPCTLFLVTNLLCRDEARWEDTLTGMINSATSSVMTLRLDGREKTWALTTYRKKRECIVELVEALQNSSDDRLRVLMEVERQLTPGNMKSMRVTMQWKEVLKLAEDHKLYFGGHSHTHPNLGDVSTDQAKWEIETSKEKMEQKLKRECRLFCYPFGKKRSFNPHVKTLLKALGFSAAVTTIPGSITRDSDPFELRRIAAIDDSSYRFKCSLIGLSLQRG